MMLHSILPPLVPSAVLLTAILVEAMMWLFGSSDESPKP